MSHRRYQKIDAWLREWEAVFTPFAIADAIEVAARELLRERIGYQTEIRGPARFDGDRLVVHVHADERIGVMKIGTNRFSYKPVLPLRLYSHQRAYLRYPWLEPTLVRWS